MKKNFFYAVLGLLALAAWSAPDLRAEERTEGATAPREVSVTIDDLPLNGPRIDLPRLRAMTDRILDGTRKHRVPLVGFVNESLLFTPSETDARIALLREWIEAGAELGNHTFSHVSFREISLAEYQDDFVRGDSVLRLLLRPKGQNVRYFRHPFLHLAPTADVERSFQNFIAARGYRIAPITIDPMDWMFLAAYAQAQAQNDGAMKKRVSEEFLKFTDRRFEHAEMVAADLFGRPIRHILLLHANELTADNFEALLKIIEKRGYRFITLERALEDPAYRWPEQYAATADWLSHWAQSKGRKFDSPRPPEFIEKAFSGK